MKTSPTAQGSAKPISRQVGRYRGNFVYEALVAVQCHDCGQELIPGDYFIRIPVKGRGIHTHLCCSRCEYFQIPLVRTTERRRTWEHSNDHNNKQHHLRYSRKHNRRSPR